MGSKKLAKLLALVLVLGLCIVGYIWIDKYQSKKDKDDTEDTSKVLIDIGKDSLTEIKYTYEGKDIELKYNSKEEEWYNVKHKSWPINQEYITAMKNAIIKVVSTRQLDTDEELREYGLEKPTVVINFVTKGGKNYKINIGKDISSVSANYCTIDDKKEVHLVESTIKSAFEYNEKKLIEVEKIPTLSSSLVYEVETKGKDFNMKAKFDGDITNNDSGEWKITKPYKNTISGMSSSFTDYFVNFESLSFEECVDINPKKLDKYGLDKPTLSVAMKYKEEKEKASEDKDDKKSDEEKKEYTDKKYTLLIGKSIKTKLDEESEPTVSAYYAMLKDGDRVYTIEKTALDNILKGRAFDFIFNAFNNTDLEQYKELKLTIGDKKYTLKKTRSQNDKGDLVVNYKINKKKLSEANGDEMYSGITELIYANEIGDKKIKKDKTIAKFEYIGKKDGASDTTIKVLNYDDNYYRVNQDGEEYFLISKVDMDNALKDIKDAAK